MTTQGLDAPPDRHRPVTMDAAVPALQAAGVVVLVLDDKLRIISAYGAVERCLGAPIPPGGAALAAYVPSTAHGALRTACADVLGGAAAQCRVVVKRRCEHGAPDVVFEITPLRGHDQPADRIVCVGRDVTYQRMQERLPQRVLGLMTHELRTPMTALKGYTQLALKRVSSTGDHVQLYRMLQIIAEQGERLAQAIDRSIDIAQIQQGQLRLLCGPVDLVALVQEVAAYHRHQSPDRMLRVHSGASCVVTADQQRIRYALDLLMNNALKYFPTSSAVDVTVTCIDDVVNVTVRGGGAGIPTAQQPFVFEPWCQAQLDTIRDVGDMELGLYVVKEIVEQHGGQVWIDDSHGIGTVFGFSLPLVR